MHIATSNALRVMTLNCAHGARVPLPPVVVGRATLARNLGAIGAAIDGVRPDVVALQEIDRAAFWSGHLDEVDLVARGARMPHVAFGAHTDVPRLGLRHGTAVLSRGALQASESTAFRNSLLDDKGWVRVTVTPAALGGRAIDVVSVHLHPVSPWARRRQIATMARAFVPRERPLVVMGDTNAAWGGKGRGDTASLARALGLHAWQPEAPAAGELGTYPAEQPWRRIDWILLSPELTFASYASVPGRVSDHRGVVAEVTWSTACG
jgi:endonuclease/exonuclease/phosphatase family metal-dependent hydrolase